MTNTFTPEEHAARLKDLASQIRARYEKNLVVGCRTDGLGGRILSIDVFERWAMEAADSIDWLLEHIRGGDDQ